MSFNQRFTTVGDETLSVAGSLLNPTLSQVDELFEIMSLQREGAGNFRAEWRINNIVTGSYAYRFSQDGATDSGNASQTFGLLGYSSAVEEDQLITILQTNVIGDEKFYISRVVNANGQGVGAGQQPERILTWGKGAVTAQTTSIQIQELFGTGQFGAGSQMQVATSIATALQNLGSWTELGRSKLTEPANQVEVTGLPNKRYYWVLMNFERESANVDPKLDFNGVGGNDYSITGSLNGANDVSNTNQPFIDQSVQNNANTFFGQNIISNLVNRQKITLGQIVANNAVGSGNAPPRRERFGKMDTTTDAGSITSMRLTGVNNYQTGTEMIVLGWDPLDTHTTELNFWQPLADTTLTGTSDNIRAVFSPKKYLWFQFYSPLTSDLTIVYRVNDDTGGNYSYREEGNGTELTPATSQTEFSYRSWVTARTAFGNGLILNNPTQEKLTQENFIDATVGVASGDEPARREFNRKWSNTVSPITSINFINTGTGSFQIGAFLRVWGHD